MKRIARAVAVWKKWRRVKFSIRLSILSIILILVVGSATLIISAHYLAVRNLLMLHGKHSMCQAAREVAEKLQNYFYPLNTNLQLARYGYNSALFRAQDRRFGQLLNGILGEDRNLKAAYFASTDGALYLYGRTQKGFIEELLSQPRSASQPKARHRYISINGDLVTETAAVYHDPRLRPWYKNAVDKKGLVWLVYPFRAIGSQRAQLGITAALPIYDRQGRLRGVFGLDLLLEDLARYLESINVTRSGIIAIVDTHQQVIAANLVAGEGKVKAKYRLARPEIRELLRVRKLVEPWVYLYEGDRYLVTQRPLGALHGGQEWQVVVIAPVNEVIAPLLYSLLGGSFFILVTVLLGIFWAHIFSASISRPVKRVARDAELVCHLQLQEVRYFFSRITEIDEMGKAFIKMKNMLSSFQRYMPVALVRQLLSSNQVATVGGELKKLTVLFIDIQGFTALSEGMQPCDLMAYLSEYLQVVTKIILNNHGTVDKYIGDGVMAFWGAPIADQQQAWHACKSAIAIVRELEFFNRRCLAAGRPTLKVRLGINTDQVVVGNVGSEDRLNYTALGEGVNLASRLENLNKLYGTKVLVSGSTYEQVKGQFRLRLLDCVAVKGATRATYVYELLDEERTAEGWGKVELAQLFQRGFSLYQSGSWVEALVCFRQLESATGDQVARMFVERCEYLRNSSPQNWQGVGGLE